MCEANAYIVEDGRERLVMESVDLIEPEGTESWRLVGLFGDQTVIKGRIKAMQLVDHKIVFESAAA